jgi:hypothetical protein
MEHWHSRKAERTENNLLQRPHMHMVECLERAETYKFSKSRVGARICGLKMQ